ncbi:hypothetical protein GLGCALEP_02960 [Pseudomonas sp. MM221]|nr:hypothetical protein DBADOPDK_02894 [Pseudomonas sp. MM223]CAI3802330.1 hypothetical protein GLGCALEP_02960 [Pseudomonas sp. MM221]
MEFISSNKKSTSEEVSSEKLHCDRADSGVLSAPTLSGLGVKLVRFTNSGAATGSIEGVFSRGSASANGRYRLYANIDADPEIIRAVSSDSLLSEGAFWLYPTEDQGSLGRLLRAPHVFVFFAREMANSGDPDSARVVYTVTEKLEKPTLSDASANKSTVTVTGVAPYAYAPVKVTVDSKSETVVATSGKSWTATFTNVPPGTHTVLAQVVDQSEVFHASDIVTGEVEVTPPIEHRLNILYPPENWPVTRYVNVNGVATPDQGDVSVGFEGETAVQARVSASGYWSATIRAETYTGPDVKIIAEHPARGEKKEVNVKMALFGEPSVSRSVLGDDGYEIVGSSLPYASIEYEGVEDQIVQWFPLLTADDQGNWRYEGLPKPTMILGGGTVDGVRYARQVFTLRADSEDREGTKFLMLNAAPTVTSHQSGDVVPQQVVFTGNTRFKSVDVLLELPDATVFSATPDNEGNWQSPLITLPTGTVIVQIYSDHPEPLKPYFEKGRLTVFVEA